VRDPHVQSLHYKLVPDARTTFSPQATPVTASTSGFTARLSEGGLTIEMLEHHSSEASAREAVESFLRAWEVRHALRVGGNEEFRFEFDGSVVMIAGSPGTSSGGGATPAQQSASRWAVLGARKLDARKLKTRNRVSVRLDFTLARSARLFLIVRGPAPSCRAVGFIPVKGHKGRNSVTFAGRVQDHRLDPGVYLISLSPTQQFTPGAPTEYVRVVSPRRSVPLPDAAPKPSCEGEPATFATSWIELVEAISPAASTARQEQPIAEVASAQKHEPDADDEEAAGLIPDVGAIGGDAADHPFLALAVLVLVGALLFAMVALVTRFLRGSWNP
jgi:hypothetical protein